MEMTQERYRNKFNKVTMYETLASMICYGAAIFIMANFGKLDTWYLVLCGIVTVSFLVILPIAVLRSLHKIRNLNIIDKSFTETLLKYNKAKKNVLRIQQWAVYFSFIQLFAVAIVFTKIFSDKDFFVMEITLRTYIAVVFSIVFVAFVARWGYSGYKRMTASAEKMIKDLER